MRLILATAFCVLALAANVSANDQPGYTCAQSGQACNRYYPEWAKTKCPQAAAQCRKSPKGDGLCYFAAPDGSGSGLRRCV
jgi:hypothetical protein